MPFLSIVIPAYNEARRIKATLDDVQRYLGQQSYDWEVVVADDGSTDATASIVEEVVRANPRVRLVRVSHVGKGWAVRNGILAARGEYRFICDADLSMPIHQVAEFLPPKLSGYDIAIGSREAPGARRVGEPERRHLMGRVFNLVTRSLAVSGIRDTQCGFKSFHGQHAFEIFELQRLKGFGFDVEVLFVAQRRGLRIVEVPIEWHYREGSKVRPIRDSVRMVGDVFNVRWAHLRGSYRAPAQPRVPASRK